MEDDPAAVAVFDLNRYFNDRPIHRGFRGRQIINEDNRFRIVNRILRKMGYSAASSGDHCILSHQESAKPVIEEYIYMTAQDR
jgi:hypothetical protein